MQLPQANAKAPVNPESQQPPTSQNNPPPLEDAPVHASTPWPEAGRMSGNLFELRKDWPIHPANNTATATTMNPKLPVVKVKPQDPEQSNSSSTVPKPEQCGWGTNCPICKNAEEDWNGKHQRQFQQTDKNMQTSTQQKYSSQHTRYKTSAGTQPSVYQRQLGTTKPAHPNAVLRCARSICRTDTFEERVGGENGMT